MKLFLFCFASSWLCDSFVNVNIFFLLFFYQKACIHLALDGHITQAVFNKLAKCVSYLLIVKSLGFNKKLLTVCNLHRMTPSVLFLCQRSLSGGEVHLGLQQRQTSQTKNT